MPLTVKIYGYGWVGKAMQSIFPNAVIHDPALGLTSADTCDVAFICVPTPLVDGRLDTSIVEQTIAESREDLIIVRSTVMPGTCDKFPHRHIVFQPEYLGETVHHPMMDQLSRPFIVIGGRPADRRRCIELYQSVYNANIAIRQMTLREAEITKLSENRAIAFKVAQCQELYDACERDGTDYYTIREAVYGDDPRFNLWFTFVYPNARGFNSKCIPKDVYGWAAWAESIGYTPTLTQTLLAVNQIYLDSRP